MERVWAYVGGLLKINVLSIYEKEKRYGILEKNFNQNNLKKAYKKAVENKGSSRSWWNNGWRRIWLFKRKIKKEY